MKTAYEILGIKIKPENTSVNVMRNLLIAQWKDYNLRAPKMIEGRERFFEFFRKEDIDDETKKELFFDKYAYIMYKTQELNNPMPTGELYEAYDLIRSQDKRAKYREVEEYYKRVEMEKKSVEDLKRRQRILGKSSLTENVTSMKDLNMAKNKNKAKADPDDRYILYTGFPYRWSVNFNSREEDWCILDDRNIKGERVIVTDLGDFRYATNIGRPTDEYPEGKASFNGQASILGITKFDAQDKIVSNNVMVANLNPDDTTNNRRFFVDVFLCDELINQAELLNKGFMGKISVANMQGAPQYYVEYNGINDRDLVTALGAAKQTFGHVQRGKNSKSVRNFTEIRKILLRIQEEYAISINQFEPKTGEKKGENLWQK